MGRTIQEIYDHIISEKESFSELLNLLPNPDSAQTLLANLQSDSDVADWRTYAWDIATAIYMHELLFDEHVQKITEIKNSMKIGKLSWYAAQMKLFQFGDEFYQETGYAILDEEKQIIKNASASEDSANEIIYVRVAKHDENGLNTVLTSVEKNAAGQYLEKIKPPGIRTSLLSDPGNLIKIQADAYYDPTILTAAGLLIADPTKEPAKEAYYNFIQQLDFTGTLSLTDLEAAVKAVDGVISFVINTAQWRETALDAWANIDEFITPPSGWFITNDADTDIDYSKKPSA